MSHRLLVRAAAFAAHAHRSQRRKCKGDVPYINHPLEVAEIVALVSDDPEILAAAMLHDTVEDTGTAQETLREHFGERVASLVAEVTDDKSLPKAERKRLQIEHAPHLSTGAKLIKLADKTHNVTSIGENPPEVWGAERIRQYLDWAETVVAGLRGVSLTLEERFDRALAKGRERWKDTD